MKIGRSSGILLHVTSLPGRYGIGDLGEESRWFVDCLAEAKQKLWCVLPLGPTGPENSPYQSRSAFAGNPLLISPQKLERHGYLSKGICSLRRRSLVRGWSFPRFAGTKSYCSRRLSRIFARPKTT